MSDRPVRVAFDIGGVLSKYPDELRRLARCVVAGGGEVFVITDMHDRAHVLDTLAANAFGFVPAENVYTADYDQHGEGCKAELLRELVVDVFLDDFVGYVTPGGAPIRCLVMPDASKPYYHESWTTLGGEPTFSRRTYSKDWR